MNHLRTERDRHITSVLIYLVLILIFMGPKLFPPSDLALGNHDTRGLFVPWLTDVRQAILSGTLPLWDAYQFAGNPFLSNPQIALFYPPTWIAVIFPVNIGLSWHTAFHLLLAATGMYLFVRQMSGGWSGAFIAGLVYAFSGFNFARIWAGHFGLLATNAWLPWILLTTVWTIKRRSIASAVIAGIPWGMAFLAGHSSSLFYVGLIWLSFLLFLALDQRAWLFTLRQALIMGSTGTALSAVQLLPFLQLLQNVARSEQSSFEFATAFSLPLSQLAALIVPGFFGDPLHEYWGAPYFEELTIYAGIVALLSFLLVFRRPSRLYGYYLLLAAVGLILALGSNTPLYEVLYDWFPPVRLLRGPARAGIIFVFAAAGMLGDVINHHRSAGDDLHNHRAVIWLRVLLTAVVVTGVAVFWTAARLPGTDSLLSQAQTQIRLNGIIWATIAAFAAILLIWWLTSPNLADTKRKGALVLLAGLVLLDLWRFGSPLAALASSGPHPMWQDAREIIGRSSARVLPWGVNIFEQNGAGQVGLLSVFGYNTLEPAAPIALAASFPDPRSQAYDILGVGYVLTNVAQEQYGDGQRPLRLIGSTDNVWVYERARTVPRARLANQFEVIPDTDRALERINQETFDPLTAVILSEEPPCQLPIVAHDAGTAEIVQESNGYWHIGTSSGSPALLVVSETAYPGWQVAIDGRAAQPLLAYTALRAVCVPAGEHQVTWQYKPTIFLWGGLFSLITLSLILAAVIKERSKN
ncbi:MAG: hypothetical protein R3293_17210 [Candidatus Promineifilaceae bacterium]|nr:hypothetical protein [Candidatus Promineifilaceae bacterium]